MNPEKPIVDFPIKIETFNFEAKSLEVLQKKENHLWPIVYFIESDKIKEAYVGESTNAYSRMRNHLDNPERLKLQRMHLIQSMAFNKSATLDIESRLIKYIAADGLFELQNGNAGLTVHNYYQQEKYDLTFEQIWSELHKRKLVQNKLEKIYNSDLFKYSPYKSLTNDQYDSVVKIIKMINSKVNKPLFIIGGAGTGKTVLGTYLVKMFRSDLSGFEIDNLDDSYKTMLDSIRNIYLKYPDLKIGFVVPQQSLRQTLKKVFSYVKGLSGKMVISANEVVKENYDLVFVDEAHRLKRRCNLSSGFQYKSFDKISANLKLDPTTCDELDWIMKCSKRQVLFYDPTQSIKPSDIKPEKFRRLIDNDNKITLTSQLRVLGGNDYIEYINDILKCTKPKIINNWNKKYELQLFDNFKEFVAEVKKMNTKHELCRLISGYSWKWQSKNNPKLYDIEIDGVKLRWNMTEVDWINSETSIDEVGCIHTCQGYDLNFGGVIFGREIDYNPSTNKIEINKKLYFDTTGKNGIKNDQDLIDYIVNIYKTMMYRGIKGTFVYAYNKNLRDYFKKYINQF